MPKVSVIVPAYNHEPYIKQCIDSVLSQTYRDFELIVVDDGSQDETPAILRGYGNQVLLIEQKNHGTQAARNNAIRASRGELVALLDSDDVWMPHKLECQVRALALQPAAGLVYAQAYVIDAHGSRLGATILGSPIEDPSHAYEQILIQNPVPALTAMVRRECLDNVGLFDESLVGAADWDMWLRIASKWPVLSFAEPVALYRVHQTNTTQQLQKSKLLLTEHLRVLDKAFANPDRPVPEPVRNAALAHAQLLSAELAASAGDAATAGAETAKALALDPSLEEAPEALVGRIVHLAHQYCGDRRTFARYRRFFRDFYAGLSPSSAVVQGLRSMAVSEATMGTVFALHAEGRSAEGGLLIPLGVAARPRWLLNKGVWSIMLDTYLGERPAGWLKRLGRSLHKRRVDHES